MSQGISCRCGEQKKPVQERRWFVLQRYGNASAFNGYRWQSSDYSCVQCHACGTVWRTKADYVSSLKDNDPDYEQIDKALTEALKICQQKQPNPHSS